MTDISLAIDTPDLARHYETVSADRQFRHGRELLERIGLTKGQRVLDVGCGTGLLAEFAASVVGPSGTVIGIDPLPLRIEIARQRATAQLSFEVGDANRLDAFADGSFDVAYLNAVFHWLPEKLGPLAGIFRLLVPGGRLALSTGAKNQLNTIQEVRNRVLSREPYRTAANPSEGLAYHVSDTELRELLTRAGFQIDILELVPHATHHPSAEAALQFAQASSFGNYLGRIPAQLRGSAEREILAEFERLREPQGVLQQGTRIVAVARKPASH
ncbi:MAG TPA: methyltransferase domain-containing protein [Polyangiaceae bacterium]